MTPLRRIDSNQLADYVDRYIFCSRQRVHQYRSHSATPLNYLLELLLLQRYYLGGMGQSSSLSTITKTLTPSYISSRAIGYPKSSYLGRLSSLLPPRRRQPSGKRSPLHHHPPRPKEWLEMAISDLDNFLHLFPDHSQAQQVRAKLQGAIDTPGTLIDRRNPAILRHSTSGERSLPLSSMTISHNNRAARNHHRDDSKSIDSKKSPKQHRQEATDNSG
jgi:hypothetical protein